MYSLFTSKYTIGLTAVLIAISFIYYNFIFPHKEENNNLIKINNNLEKSLTLSETKLLLCLMKKKTLTFENDMKGIAYEIDNNISTAYTNFTF